MTADPAIGGALAYRCLILVETDAFGGSRIPAISGRVVALSKRQLSM